MKLKLLGGIFMGLMATVPSWGVNVVEVRPIGNSGYTTAYNGMWNNGINSYVVSVNNPIAGPYASVKVTTQSPQWPAAPAETASRTVTVTDPTTIYHLYLSVSGAKDGVGDGYAQITAVGGNLPGQGSMILRQSGVTSGSVIPATIPAQWTIVGVPSINAAGLVNGNWNIDAQVRLPVGQYNLEVHTHLQTTGGTAAQATLETTYDAPKEKRPVTVTAQSPSKVYDGSTLAVGAPAVTSGTIFPGTTLIIAGTPSSIGPNAGPVTTTVGAITIMVGGWDATSLYGPLYNFTKVNGTANITQRAITVTLGGSKTYDGSTAATGATATITSGSLAAGDTLAPVFANTPSANVNPAYSGLLTATINNPSAPNNRTTSYSITYNGSYAITAATQAAVTTDNPTAVYGNTATATPGGGSGTGAYTFEYVAGGTASGGSVTAAGAITATSWGTVNFRVKRELSPNYLVSGWTSGTATFTQRPITVTLGGSKTYNTTTAPTGATATITSGSLAAGDTLAPVFANTPSANVNPAYSGLLTATINNPSAPNNRTTSYSITYNGSYAITLANQPKPTLTISPASIILGGTATLTPSGGLGSGSFSYAITAGLGSIFGTTLTPSSTGTVSVHVQRAGDGNYNPSAWSDDASVFVQQMFMLAMASNPAGGTLTGSGTYVAGTNAPMTASMVNMIFTGWSGDAAGTANPASITMNANKSVVANFMPATATLTLVPGAGGSASGGGTYSINTTAFFTATPDATHRFVGFSGDFVGMTNPGSLLMTADKTVIVNFAAKLSQTITFTNPGPLEVSLTPYTLTASASSGLPVTLTYVSGPATLLGNQITVTGIGNITVRATQAGDATYLPAAPVDQTFAGVPPPVEINATGDSAGLARKTGGAAAENQPGHYIINK